MTRFAHGTTDSTNERALASIESGEAKSGDVHVADAQTAGRGRRGRVWEAAPGESLLLSLVWCPPRPATGAALTIAAGLAALEAIQAAGLDRARLDWPNDIVCGEAKLAGILVETRGPKPDRPAYVVGVGINVAQSSFPAWLTEERAVTSLALEGVRTTASAVEEPLVQALGTWLGRIEADPAGLAQSYLEAGGFEGAVTLVTRGKTLHGTTEELELDTGLLVRTDSGPIRVPLEHLERLEPGAP